MREQHGPHFGGRSSQQQRQATTRTTGSSGTLLGYQGRTRRVVERGDDDDVLDEPYPGRLPRSSRRYDVDSSTQEEHILAVPVADRAVVCTGWSMWAWARWWRSASLH